jgi:hypothetical protein
MEFGSEVEAMRSAWKTNGFPAAKALITDRLFDGLPFVGGSLEKDRAILPGRAPNGYLAVCFILL